MRGIGRTGPRPHAQGTFRIREHDRAPVRRRSRTGVGGVVGKQGAVSGPPGGPLGAPNGRGTALASDFRRLRYAAQDLDFAPRARWPHGGRTEEGRC